MANVQYTADPNYGVSPYHAYNDPHVVGADGAADATDPYKVGETPQAYMLPADAGYYGYAQAQAQVIYKDPVKRRKCCGGCGCFCSCLVVLIVCLIVLVPHAPRASYDSGVAVLHTDGSTTLNETYKVRNPNFYSVSFDNMNLTVTYDGNYAGSGTLAGDGKFTVAKHSTKKMTISYRLWENGGSSRQEANQDCVQNGKVKYKTKGTMDAEFWLRHFKDLDLGPWTETVICES